MLWSVPPNRSDAYFWYHWLSPWTSFSKAEQDRKIRADLAEANNVEIYLAHRLDHPDTGSMRWGW